LIRIVCQSCGAAYKVSRERLTKAVHRATCKSCGNKIIIRTGDRPLAEEAPGWQAPPAPRPAQPIPPPVPAHEAQPPASDSEGSAALEDAAGDPDDGFAPGPAGPQEPAPAAEAPAEPDEPQVDAPAEPASEEAPPEAQADGIEAVGPFDPGPAIPRPFDDGGEERADEEAADTQPQGFPTSLEDDREEAVPEADPAFGGDPGPQLAPPWSEDSESDGDASSEDAVAVSPTPWGLEDGLSAGDAGPEAHSDADASADAGEPEAAGEVRRNDGFEVPTDPGRLAAAARHPTPARGTGRVLGVMAWLVAVLVFLDLMGALDALPSWLAPGLAIAILVLAGWGGIRGRPPLGSVLFVLPLGLGLGWTGTQVAAAVEAQTAPAATAPVAALTDAGGGPATKAARVATAVAPERSGVLTDVVIETLMQQPTAVRECFARETQRGWQGGAVEVKLSVEPDGAVARARLQSPTELRGSELDGCLVSAVSNIHFPPPGGDGPMAIAYTYTVVED
jgi:DNA-directed RNA polymerase subunit RPC12/RpoP